MGEDGRIVSKKLILYWHVLTVPYPFEKDCCLSLSNACYMNLYNALWHCGMNQHETTAWIYPRTLKDPLLLRRLSRELCGSGYGTSTRIWIGLVDLGCFHWFQMISILGSQDMSRGLSDNTVYICIRMYTVCIYIYMLSYIKIQWDSWSTEAVDKLWRWTLQVKSLALPGVQWRLVHSEHATLARPIQANLRAGDEENAWSRSGFEADVRCITVSFNSFNVFECSLFFQAQLKWLQ